MPLFEITITGYKVFYVIADDKDEALSTDIVEDEMSSMIGEVDWEADSATSRVDESVNIDACERHGIPVYDKDSNRLV